MNKRLPAGQLRLDRARTLGAQYLSYDNDRDQAYDPDGFACNTEQLADLIDAVTAAKDKTIAALRKDVPMQPEKS